ncbi:MAG: hypothetical protein EXR50_00960 [Dehalococcoidia bacterium]|nr:hypothetical protein [Dehalococcoidia bacterium]
MPFVQRTTWIPALGKGPELRALLEERVKLRNAQGGRSGVSAQLFGPEGPAFVFSTVFPDLASREQLFQRQNSDPAYQASLAKSVMVASKAAVIELFETLVPNAPRIEAKVTQRITLYPAIGKGPELRAMLEEEVKARQARGITSGLQAQLFGIDGPAFTIGTQFPGIAAFEQRRESVPNDPGRQAYLAKVNQAISRPNRQQLFEVLVQVPPA